MRILVTGISGRIGGAIAARLALRHQVTGIDRRPGALTVEVVDVCDTKRLVPLLAGLDAIVHTASLHVPDLAACSAGEFHAVNVDATRRLLAAAGGIEVRALNDTGDLSLYVDGADEATRHLALIKGGGGALTREKIVAAASRRFVCIVDDSKVVDVLGRFPLPVEVIPMARSLVARKLAAMGGQPVLRQGFRTDNGNEILDVHNLKITDPSALEEKIGLLAGVVEVGLFARRGADVLLVAGDGGVKKLTR